MAEICERNKHIGAVILAAGLSTRMGSPKMVLPWGDTVVICQVVDVLQAAGLSEILVITGGARRQVEKALQDKDVTTVFNPDHQRDHMILSLKIGLSNLSDKIDAILVVLGDQPQIQADVVRSVIDAYRQTDADLVIPSYHMRRGHPWLLKRTLWDSLLVMEPPKTMREFLNTQKERIVYVQVDTVSVLQDIDTPFDYERERPSVEK